MKFVFSIEICNHSPAQELLDLVGIGLALMLDQMLAL